MMQFKNFQVPAVNEYSEVRQIVSAIRDVPGIINATGDRTSKVFIVQWSDPASWDDIHKAIEKLGYTPQDSEGF